MKTNNDLTHSCEINLPAPEAGKLSDVVIFDGKCRFCCRQVSRLARWDQQGKLTFLSLHDSRVADLVPDLSHEQLMREMVVVAPDGRRYSGAQALRYLSRRLPSLWWLAPLVHLPFTLPFWNWAYHKVASHRYELSRTGESGCANGKCDLHLRKHS